MMIISALPFPRKRASVVAMTDKDRKMTDKPMTLRAKALDDAKQLLEDGFSIETVIENLCLHLEDTGAPAHMRVAKELRGED